jgi:hypothetical protein
MSIQTRISVVRSARSWPAGLLHPELRPVEPGPACLLHAGLVPAELLLADSACGRTATDM